MNTFNKKGISAIVATVLIILITVAAVTIIWAAIIPLVSNQLERGTVCLDATSQLDLPDKGFTCSDSATNTLVQIGRGAVDAGIQDVQIVLTSGGSSVTERLLNNANVIHSVAGGQVTAAPGVNELGLYNVTGLVAVESISVAPIVTIGNAEEICDVARTLTIQPC